MGRSFQCSVGGCIGRFLACDGFILKDDEKTPGYGVAWFQTLNETNIFLSKSNAFSIGLAFQIVDDILDVVGDTAELGKTAGKDALGDKPTYVSLLGLEKAKELAEEQYLIAAKAVEGLSEDLDSKERLIEIADFIIKRTH